MIVHNFLAIEIIEIDIVAGVVEQSGITVETPRRNEIPNFREC